MKKLLCAFGLVFALQLVQATEAGPSTNEIRAAMMQYGIAPGATFQFNGHSYRVHNLSVSKGGITYHVSMDATLAE